MNVNVKKSKEESQAGSRSRLYAHACMLVVVARRGCS